MAILNEKNTSQIVVGTPCTQEQVDTSFAFKPIRRHRQFLPQDNAECHFESLKGYDHTIHTTSCCSSSNGNDNSQDMKNYISPEKVSDGKQRGGGSWLLGFARRHTHHNQVVDEQPSSSTSLSTSSEIDIPGLVRSNSASSLESISEDDASTVSSSSSKKKGVTFNETVLSRPIPHASEYTPSQRRRMYTSSLDVRSNKIRNKKEFRYDGYEWRNCTEEWEMSVCMVTGELVHPVHSI